MEEIMKLPKRKYKYFIIMKTYRLFGGPYENPIKVLAYDGCHALTKYYKKTKQFSKIKKYNDYMKWNRDNAQYRITPEDKNFERFALYLDE
jgi:hypothetical protein